MAAAPAPGEWTPLLDECIMLKVLEPGDGEGPEPKDTAICSYVARLRDTRRVFLEETGARFTIGEGETTMGLELALRHMCVNERALVVVDPKYAHGPLGRKRISPEEVEVPPDTWVEYDVTLHRTVFLPDADVAEKVAHGQYLKTKGNDHFRRQELREALRSYGTALKLLGGEATDNPTALTLVVDCHNNAAAVLGKQEEWNKAKEAIVEALSLAPDNVRSLTRAADIAMALADWEEAEMAWSHALEVAFFRSLTVLNNGAHVHSCRLPQNNDKCREARKAASAHPPCLKCDHPSPQGDAKAWLHRRFRSCGQPPF